QEIHIDSLTLASTDNDLYREITRNIESLENQLVSNYESVKNSFKENFSEIIDKIGYGNQDSYNEILNRKIDELNILVDNLKTNNEESLQNIAKNLNEASQKNVSQILENLDDKIGSISEKIENKVDWYETNRQEEFSSLSEKLSDKLESIVSDINESKEENQRLIFDLINNNNREREYVVDILNKIDTEHRDTLGELEARIVSDSNKKLETLEDLIILQNNELEELLDDKNNVINEIEKAISRKVKNQDNNPIHLEKTILEISKNFESRIDNLESRFNDKLQEIHVDSLTLASTDNDLYREITRNIESLENQLVSNYESVKNSFKENFSEIIDKIGYGNQDSYNESLNRKIDELNILVDNLKEKNDQHIQNFQDFKESSKKDVSEMFNAFSDKLDSIGQEIGSKVDWYENNRQEELDNLAEKFDSKIENLINDINETTEINQQLVLELIEKNNKEKDYIISFLHKIDVAHQDTLNELEAKIISESNKKIETLEDLIILQNNELEELLDDKNNVIDEIEKIISKKEKSQDNNPIHLEKTILEISKNFESRIDNLESRFNDKLNEINVNSLVLASTDNDLYREITRNIEGLESQLVNNYESVKNSFKESFAEIIDKIGYGNQGNYNEILSRKIDELNVLVDNLKENNEISLQNLEENLKTSSKKDISEMFENFNNRLGSVSEEISRKVDWYENNRQEELNNLSEKISNQLKYLINDIHNERLEDNQR
ncbi:MAG: hypothetical protein K2I67_02095, partial [Malacoplasma sp.]|nr:hypothetical protein [Malacoplasma sp.]